MTGNEMALMASIAVDMQDKEVDEVLDKIRAEIISLTDGDIPERIWNVDVLEIIDKYKAEVDKQEGSERG